MAEPAALPDWLAGERRLPTPETTLGAIGGLVVLAGFAALFGELPDKDSRVFAVALSLFTLVAGCVLTVFRQYPALRAAGVALAAGAVLPLAVVVVEQPQQYEKADLLVAGLLAALVWAALFVGSPARGHGLFLGLSLAALWMTALSQTEPLSFVSLFDARTERTTRLELEPQELRVEPMDPFEPIDPPAITVPSFPRSTFTVPTMPEPVFPEPIITSPTPTFVFPSPSTTTTTASTTTTSTTTTTTTTTAPTQEESLGRPELIASSQERERDRPPIAPGVVSLLFGALYFAAAVVLDENRLRRLASAFLVVGVVAVLVGAIGFGPRYGAWVSGFIALCAGGVFVGVGLAGARRLLAWFGALVTALGVAALVDEAFEEPGGGTAVALLLVGAVIVAGGAALSRRPAPPGSG